VRRATWGNTCARVVRVGEMTEPGPYFGNPSVLMDVYSLQGELKEEAAALPVAGTYKTWRKIDPPDWAKSADLRSLDDPKLDEALLRLNRKRHKAKPPPERIRLNVTAGAILGRMRCGPRSCGKHIETARVHHAALPVNASPRGMKAARERGEALRTLQTGTTASPP
jgi:hypothetical protein